MSQTTDERIHWTTSDIERLPESSNRYEIIDGELFATRAPHWKHQKTCGNVGSIGITMQMFAMDVSHRSRRLKALKYDADNVIPDVVWISKTRLAVALDEAGHLPELAIEVLSPGLANEQRDREAKLKLYGSRGVQECGFSIGNCSK